MISTGGSERKEASEGNAANSERSNRGDDLTASASALLPNPHGRHHCLRVSVSDQECEEFEISFPPNVPLGITFEWAVDPAACPIVIDSENLDTAYPVTARFRPRTTAGEITLTTAPRGILQRPRSAGLPDNRKELCFTRAVAYSGGSIPTLPRISLPLASLPAFPTPSTSKSTESLVPHVLRIRSFPTHFRGSATLAERNSATPNPVADGSSSAGAVVEHKRSIDAQEPSTENKPVDRPVAATELRRATGPSAGRDMLCVGDVLVQVNGKPVAGPAARRAGILSFQDAVNVVAAVTETKEDGGGHGPRILKFRRAEQPSLPPSCHPPAFVTLPPAKSPRKRERAFGLLEGNAANKVQGNAWREGSIDSTDTSDGSNRSGLREDFSLKSSGWSADLNVRGNETRRDQSERKSILQSRSATSRGTSNGSSGDSSAAGRKRKKDRTASESLRTVLHSLSCAERIKPQPSHAEALLEPWVCPRQRLIKRVLENSDVLRPVAVRLTNLSYWYQQRRILGGSRHMCRKTTFDPKTRRWEASIYALGDRPKDGKLVPMLTPSTRTAGTVLRSEGQAFAQASKSAQKRDANPFAARGRKPEGTSPSTMLQTHMAILVASEVFKGLRNDERLAIVFMALFDGLVAEAGKDGATLNATTTLQRSDLSRSACSEQGRGPEHDKHATEADDPSKTAAASGSTTSRKRNRSTVNLSRSNSSFPEGVFSIDSDVATGNSEERGVGTYTCDAVRAGVKASFVGANVRALPVWGGLGLIAGTSLLVECRTPAQWQPQIFRPTGQELWGPARSGHTTLANDLRVEEVSVKKALKRIVAESKALRETAPTFQRFDRFAEGENHGSSRRQSFEKTPGAPAYKEKDASSLPRHRTRHKDCIDVKRNGGSGGNVLPHFFHGLGKNTRSLLLELHAENRYRLLAGRPDPNLSPCTNRGVFVDTQSMPSAPSHGSRLPMTPPESTRQTPRSITDESFKGKVFVRSGDVSVAPTKARHAPGSFAALGPPPDPDAAILDWYGVLQARLVEAAIRIQRIRRIGDFPRAARRLRRRQRAALFVQRVFRGHLGRRYAAIWKLVANLASTRVSTEWRRFVAQRTFLVMRARARAGAICLQALYRGHIGRRYATYYARYYNAARTVQSGARGFVARCRSRRMRASRAWKLYGLPALLLIQRVVRGFLVRKVFARRFEEAVRVKIVVPAAGVIQKCWRGKLGRKEAALQRRKRATATKIQRHARGFIKRRWWTRVLRHQLEHALATKIAAVGRGYIDRELMKHRRMKHHFLHIVTPAAISIQAQWRGYTKRRDFSIHKRRWLAALYIQVTYRGAMCRREARSRYHALMARHKGLSVIKIQCLFRRWQARRLFRVRLVEARWKRTFASRIILRTWRFYKINMKLDELKTQWRVEKAALELAEAQRDLKEIKADLDLCKEDIAAVKKFVASFRRRQKELSEFRKEAILRLHVVERHIDELTLADFEGGWAEAYSREWHTLINCMSMALEEGRIMQLKCAKLERELGMLQLEIDDQETDMDEASMREFDRTEALRRSELKVRLDRAVRHKERAVRRERMRWAVRDVRRKVIRRSRQDLVHFAKLARAKRPLEVEHTLSYEVRRDRERDEEAEIRMMEREAQKHRFEGVKEKGEGNQDIREVYDAVISSIRDIISKSTFDARRAKTDYRGRGPNEVGPAASAAATAAATTARKAALAIVDDSEVVETVAAMAAADASALATVAGSELGGGNVCRACGGPRFNRTVCAKCGAHSSMWLDGAVLNAGGDR